MDAGSIYEAKYKTQAILGIMADKLGVGIAKMMHSDEHAALGVAIIKATIQDETVPKEKHVQTLIDACSAALPETTVDFVVLGLFKRLEENAKTWLVTLKSLVVIHRLMREADPAFQVELLRHGDGTGRPRLFSLDTFADTTTKETSHYSACIRAYSAYLDERLATLRLTRFDPAHTDKDGNKVQGPDQAAAALEGGSLAQDASESKPHALSVGGLLEYVASMERLLGLALACVPEGAARENEVTLLACSQVFQELLPVYHATNEAVRSLVDRIFRMGKADADKGEELVKSYKVLTGKLATFVANIGGIPALQGVVQLPTLEPLPNEILAKVEEYAKNAPAEPPKPPSASPPSMADLLGFQSFILKAPALAASNGAANGAAAAATGAAAVGAAAATATVVPPVSFDPFASYTAPEPPKPPADAVDQVFGDAVEALTLAVTQEQRELPVPEAAEADTAPPPLAAAAAEPATAAADNEQAGSTEAKSPAALSPARSTASAATPSDLQAAATATVSVVAAVTAQPYALNAEDPMDFISKELFGDRTAPAPKPMRPSLAGSGKCETAPAADAPAAGSTTAADNA